MTSQFDSSPMTDSTQEFTLPIPKAFFEQVKQALENLYDFPLLQNHPLAQNLPKSHEHSGQRLRRDLIAAIEKLNPGADVFFRSPHARLYNLLQLHYVEAMTIQEAAYELGISPRQAYRVLRRGQESVALILWDSYGLASQPLDSTLPSPETHLSLMQSELARLRVESQRVDAVALLQSAHKVVDRLALQLGVDWQLELPTHPVWLATHLTVAQQAFITLFSHAIKQAQGRLQVQLRLTPEGEPFLELAALPSDPHAQRSSVLDELLQALEWRLEATPTSQGGCLRLYFADAPQAEQITLLIIDDNQGLIDLVERYLSGQACQLLSSTQSSAGLVLAQETHPDAILLDIMMPGMDGWELLQRLRTNPQTEAIPVIICSVFNDPELAFSLGAAAFLAKPLQREGLLQALQSLAIL
jgi:CheY-like chemotaxis protein